MASMVLVRKIWLGISVTGVSSGRSTGNRL
jgi:hypothetical protein